MLLKSLGLAAGVGLLTGLLIAIPLTAMDWYQNSGGIFRDASDTHWHIIWETAFSWFWPFFFIAASAALLLRLWWVRSKTTGKGEASL